MAPTRHRTLLGDTDMRVALRDRADAWRRAFEGEPATPADMASLVLHALWAEDDMRAVTGQPAERA